jgi:polar amino acid transport system substrate-binding protein
MNEEELEIIKENFSSSKSYLMVGFNRRFAPLIQNVKKHLNSSVPVAINYRINAGVVAADHWTQNPKIGGGRIIGEVCHFIDLCRFIAGASITYVSAIAMKSASNTEDTVCIQLQFENGSVATINYFANGPKELPKEQIEVFASGSSYIINDFKILTIYNKSKKVISSNQDKGHSTELVEFVNAIKNGTKTPIPFQEIYESMLTTFKSIYSLRNNGLLVPLKK